MLAIVSHLTGHWFDARQAVELSLSAMRQGTQRGFSFSTWLLFRGSISRTEGFVAVKVCHPIFLRETSQGSIMAHGGLGNSLGLATGQILRRISWRVTRPSLSAGILSLSLLATLLAPRRQLGVSAFLRTTNHGGFILVSLHNEEKGCHKKNNGRIQLTDSVGVGRRVALATRPGRHPGGGVTALAGGLESPGRQSANCGWLQNPFAPLGHHG